MLSCFFIFKGKKGLRLRYYDPVISTNEGIKLSEKAWDKLMSYSYPGNVRELENVMKRAKATAGGERVEEGDIDFDEDLQVDVDEQSVAEILFREMVEEGKSFWEVVHKPFLKRELNRREVKEIIELGLRRAGISYKRLQILFNAGDDKKNYKKFVDFLRNFDLQLKAGFNLPESSESSTFGEIRNLENSSKMFIFLLLYR